MVEYIGEEPEAPLWAYQEAVSDPSELRHAGVMPPLRISSHAITKNDIYREGVVKKTDEDVVWVECGLDRLVAIRINEDKEITEGDRISLEVKRNPLRASVVDDPPGYWGYTVKSGSILEWIDGFNGTIIGTSRKGEKVGVDLMLDDICIDNIGLVFGSPERGIQKILDDYYGYNIKEMDFDYVLNTIPRQGSETVRTEEALLATLSLFNILKK